MDGKPGTIPVHSHMGSLGSSPIRTGQPLNLPLDSVARGYLVKTEMSLPWFSLVVKFHEQQADEGNGGILACKCLLKGRAEGEAGGRRPREGEHKGLSKGKPCSVSGLLHCRKTQPADAEISFSGRD